MKKVLIALSSGVDSSVSALLLKEAGFDVHAIHFIFRNKKWLTEDSNSFKKENFAYEYEQEIELTKKVAAELQIPLEICDVSDEFRDIVIKYFIDEYKNCRTANPCVFCNRNAKMKFLFEKMAEGDFDYIATGHYAKTVNQIDGISDGNCEPRASRLSRAKCLEKDQSYVLSQVSNEILEKCIFPLANFDDKQQVRQYAKDHGLPVFDKKDSTDICFINKGRTAEFLSDNISASHGKIIDTAGNILETHEGLHNYTVGQRRGMNIKIPTEDGSPRYVVGFDKENNNLIIGDKEELLVKRIITGEPHFINENYADKKSFKAMAQIRAHARAVDVVVDNSGENTLTVDFLGNDLYGAAVGQYIVLYNENNEEVIASSTIESVCNKID